MDFLAPSGTDPAPRILEGRNEGISFPGSKGSLPIDERTYSDFDLAVEPTGDSGYRARVVGSPAGEAASSFAIPFSELELENFLLKVGRPRRGTRRLESPEMEAARQFGTQLFNAVFHDEVRVSLSRSLDAAERNGEGLRIRLRFTDAPELASLPWEYLFDTSTDQFLVLSTWTPIVRYLDLRQRTDPLIVDGPLRVLVMISSPHDYPSLDVGEEWHLIEQSLAPLVARGVITVQRVEGAQLVDLQRHLRQEEWHIFHFVGHGGYDSQVQDGVIVLEDGQGRARVVPGRALGTIVHDHRSLRLAVLNACEGARASQTDPFSGTAQSLVRLGIPAVVAMQFEITDDAAIAFAREFYAAISDGFPVDGAIGESRRAIFGLGNDIEWATPVIYLRGDGHLFDIRPSPSPAVVPHAQALPESSDAQTTESASEPRVDTELPPNERVPGVPAEASRSARSTADTGAGAARAAAPQAPSPPQNDRHVLTRWASAVGVLSLALIVALVGLVLALADGEGESEMTEPPTTTAASVTTLAPVTTVVTASVPEPTPPVGFYQVAVPTWFPEPLPGSGGDFGSGCAPGPGPLPDGIWFGFVDASESSVNRVIFDLACLGPDLVARNESETQRVVGVHEGAVSWVFDSAGENVELMWYSDWWRDPDLVDCGFDDLCAWGWLYVNDSLVTEVVPIPSES